MINTLKVKSRLVELGLNQKDVAKKLGLSLPTVSQKINNKRPMHLNEVMELANLLMIDETKLVTYFFCNYVAYSNLIKREDGDLTCHSLK
ncbi:helix-turn-helix transcriptional regulator [Neobacillus sp. FSL H8-0543]|uniref:helix-turn-helix transcriptional regulator n=1 Tax=Neobacillus sp. FSL H8-0543 TaxID=2954672 RepID=UPI0031586734